MAYASSCLRALSILILASILVAGSAEKPPSILASTASSTTYSVAVNYNKEDHEYLIDLEIGTRPEQFRAVLDTGSNIVLLTNLSLCSPTSSSFTHEECSQSAEPTCCGGLRMFENKYGGKKTAHGFMGKETLTFFSPKTGHRKVPGVVVVVSCAIYAHCDDARDCDKFPESAAGIVGLGRGPQSLLSQLNPKERKFSYCLNDQQDNPDLKSHLLIGHVPDFTTTDTTPLVKIEGNDKYYVKLHAISIGDHSHECKEKCQALMLVDSGTSYSSLPGDAFDQVENYVAELFKQGQGCEKITPSEGTPFYCYPVNCLKVKGIKPAMILSFENGTKMSLPWKNYMVEVDHGEKGEKNDMFCLILERGGNGFVLGNFQQQNMEMMYDLTEGEGTLSFVATDCSYELKHAHIA